MSDGDWQRRAPYGDQSSAPGGGGRRRAGGQAGAPPHPQDSYGQNPYGQDPYAPPTQRYAQPPQGYAPPSYGDQPGYAPAPPPPAAPPAASGRGRRAAPRTGPKVVQSEVISPAAQDYGYDSRDGYGADPYAQPGDPYGPPDDGWNDAASQGYVDDRYDTGRGGYQGGGDDGWDDRGDGDWGDDDFMDGGPPRRSKLRAWAPLFALIIVLGAFSGCMYGGYAYYKSKHGPAPDYANTNCPGPVDGKDPVKDQGKAVIEIPPNAIGAKIGQILYDGGVVKSVRAYVQAANANQASSGIQSGTFDICKGISGDQAVKELLKNANIEKNSQIDVKSSEWSTEVVQWFVDKKHWPKSDFDNAIKNNTIGLPAWSKTANGDWTAEGMLEPGLYPLSSKDNAQTVLTRMVAARMDKLKSIDFEKQAATMTCGSVKCTPEQVMIIASMAESEVKSPAEASKVAEAVYAHLKNGEALGIDSTARYTIGRKVITAAQASDPNNPYSTYDPHKGLPPGPISVPSIDTISAVLHPTDVGAYYWCAKSDATTDFFLKKQLSLQRADCAATKK